MELFAVGFITGAVFVTILVGLFILYLSVSAHEQHDLVARKIDALSSDQVRAWLDDRRRNCHRLASRATGRDRDEWLDDAAFFAAAIGLIDWTAAAGEEP